jgi:beta-N-acetylhexosaminidase
MHSQNSVTSIIDPEAARKIAGQLIMIRMPETELSSEMANFLREHHIRAVCLFRGNMQNSAQLKKLTSDLRAVMGPEALIAIDQEGGAVVRATWTPHAPSAMSLGASGDVAMAKQVGAAVARSIKSLGFNWNFAPVLDLNNNVNNPVIAERSFGSDPKRAADLALAWMAGSLDEGVACCVKHFPGHGDTDVDSHRDLPTVDKSRAALDALELAPFKTASQHHAPAMMSAHIVYPALDADNPATMSRTILHDMLRTEWNYQGVVITDGMDMHAIAGRYGVGNAAVKALSAGADMVMALGNRETQLETLGALSHALQKGEVLPQEVQDKLQRIRTLVQTYPCLESAYGGDNESGYNSVQEAQDHALMAQAWQAGITPYGDLKLPALASKIRLIVSADVVSDGVSEAGIPAAEVAALLGQIYDVESTYFDEESSFDWDCIPKDGRTTILASTTRLRYSEHARSTWQPDLHLVLWNPFQALDIKAPALITYGFAPAAMQAVLACLKGEVVAQGVMPVQGF